MRFTPRWLVALAGLLVVFIAGGFAVYSLRHGPALPALTAAVDRAKGAATADSGVHVTATRATDAAVDSLRKTVTVYDTLRKHLAFGDTAKLLGQIPAFVLSADGLRDRAAQLDSTLHRERAAAAKLDEDRLATIHAQDDLVAALRTPPRLASRAAYRYDPIGHVHGVAADVGVRAIGDWSVGAGGEAWLGAERRAYLLVSHPIF